METSLESLVKRIETLEAELKSLQSKIAGLESQGSAEIKAGPQPTPERHPAAPVVREKRPSLFEKLNAKLGGQIELSIGGFVIGIVGALAFIFGAGWFIKLAIERRWLNESMRVIGSILMGFGAIVSSWILAKKRLGVLPAVVLGTGHAVLYFAIFSAYYFYNLLPMREAFIFLFILSIASTVFAAALKSQSLYIFSLIGAFMAPILMSQGENSYRFLFSYLTLFNVIFVLMSKKFSWKTTAYFLLLCDSALYFEWQSKNLPESSFLIPALFITALFHIFMLRYYFILKRGASIHSAEHILVVMNIALYTLLGHITVQQFHPAYIPHFYLLVCFFVIAWQFPYRGLPDAMTRIYIGDWTILGIIPLIITAAAIFCKAPWELTAAVAFSGTLSLLGSYQNQKSFSILAIPLWCLTIILMLAFYHAAPPGSWLVLNKRFYLYALSALFLALTFYFRRTDKKFWAYGFAALFLIILASLFESRGFFPDDMHTRRLSYSYIFLAYAFVLLVPGFKFSKPALRFTGLSLIGIVIVKFYIYDMWTLSLIARIVAGFSLGIILVLTAVVYQKFRERLLKAMFSKKMLVMVFILTAAASNAEPVRVKSFEFYKDVIIDAPVDKGTIYGTIELDDELNKYSYGYDLRIVHNGEALPYFLVRRQADEKKQNKLPTIIFHAVSREESSYILELPAIPAEAEYTELEVAAATANNFEMNIDLSTSEDLKSWKSVGTYFIFKYSTTAYNRLAFHLPKSRYLRLETNKRLALAFPRISYLTKKSNDYVRTVPLEEMDRSSDPDRDATVYYYRNEKRKIISQVMLNFSDERFYRKIEIYVKSGKQYNYLMSGSIFQNKPARQIIELIYPTREEMKLLVINGDNQPLKLESFTITGPREMLVFELPRTETIAPLRLYYGNRYIKMPDYDIQNTYDKNAKHIPLRLGIHSENREFSYSMIEPPVSTWIIRILFIAGFLSLVWPSYRIMKKYTEDTAAKKDARE